MLQIVHVVINRLAPAQLMGVHRLVYALAEAESKLGLGVSIWDIGDDITAGDIDNVSHTSFAIQPNRLVLAQSMREAIDKLPDASVMHIHGGFIPEYFALSRYIRKSQKQIRLIFSPHGDYSEIRLRSLSPLKRAYYYLFERPMIKQASLVHLIGPTEMNGYNFFMNKETPFVYLPNGIKNSENPREQGKPAGGDPFVITYSGDLSIIAKGLDLLLDCFRNLCNSVSSPVQLWIIGKGKDAENLKTMAGRMGIEDKVKFFGNIPRQKREELFLKSSFFVSPSRIDNGPDHALEAAAVGVPMIISEETNLGAFIRQYEAGWYLSRNTTENLLQAMHEAYVVYRANKEGYARLRQRSASMIREELNWNALAKKWKAVYSGVV
jgi:glycosyltransferase involved in cell wall biosynthesis